MILSLLLFCLLLSKYISYIAYILNLIIQDIFKGLMKNNYNTSYFTDLYKQEIKELKDKEKIKKK